MSESENQNRSVDRKITKTDDAHLQNLQTDTRVLFPSPIRMADVQVSVCRQAMVCLSAGAGRLRRSGRGGRGMR